MDSLRRAHAFILSLCSGPHDTDHAEAVGGLKCRAPAQHLGSTMADDAKLSARRMRLKLALEDLREMKGFGTELVTLIIPPDRQVSDARSMLQNEHGQAANIKSKGTRKNVQGAIESAISTLSRYKPPANTGWPSSWDRSSWGTTRAEWSTSWSKIHPNR